MQSRRKRVNLCKDSMRSIYSHGLEAKRNGCKIIPGSDESNNPNWFFEDIGLEIVHGQRDWCMLFPIQGLCQTSIVLKACSDILLR
jgi:hypothetical protein